MTILEEMLPALIFIVGLTGLAIALTLAKEPARRAKNWLNELRIVLRQYFRKKVRR